MTSGTQAPNLRQPVARFVSRMRGARGQLVLVFSVFTPELADRVEGCLLYAFLLPLVGVLKRN